MSKIYEALQLARGERARGLIPQPAEAEPADIPSNDAAPPEPALRVPTLPPPTDRGAERRAQRRVERPAPPQAREESQPGILPDLPPGVLRRSGFDVDREMASLAAALNGIETEGNKGIVIHVVSVHAGEGSSTVARELASHLADHSRRRILLLDADDDGRAQARWFGMAEGEGVADRALDGRPIDGAVAPIGNTVLHVGLLAEDPATITNATERNAVAALYEQFRGEYAITIIDCPPIEQAPDMVALSRHADGVVMLIEAGRTRAPIAMRARDMIADAGGRVIGVVLNKRRDYIPDFLYRLL
jgi:Mrp family chromosome partitioning ATPase